MSFESGLKSIDGRSIFDVKWQRVPDRKARIRKSTITFHLAFIEWEFQEACVSTGMKRLGRRVQVKEVRKISRSRVVNGVETEAGKSQVR